VVHSGSSAGSATSDVADQDPRVERSRRVILEAVLDELGKVGYGPLTIEAVAARAGVGKSTIYRHWPGKLALVEDAFRTLKAPVVVPDTGTLRDRLVSMLQQMAGLVEQSTYSACMPALIDAAERDPQVRDFHCRFSSERRAVLVGVLQDAVADGELLPHADPELLADALVGAIMLRRLMLYEPFDPALVHTLVDQILPVAAQRDAEPT
jgi:TetR/AcrR family transcriptional regulator, regulator of autoinduction and epiphytic fitness